MSSGDAGQMANENGKYVNVDDAALLMAAEWLVSSEGNGWVVAWTAWTAWKQPGSFGQRSA